jgi:tryptophan-rich sensory protein
MKNTLRLFITIVICEVAGIIGSIFTTPSIGTWYVGIIKPSFNPPNWIFGPVWATLFLLMGISLYLVWTQKFSGTNIRGAVRVFGIQLGLNVLWSIIFFGFHSSFGALVCLVVLWLTILLTMKKFYPISRLAAWLLLPYILWVSFAGVLNFFILKLN